MYNYDTSYSSTVAASTAGGAILGILTVILVIVSIIRIVAMWRLFTKASKPGWASLIPIYNVVVLFQISGMSPWLILLYMIPVANLIIQIMLYVNLAKAYGKGTGVAIGLIFYVNIRIRKFKICWKYTKCIKKVHIN